MNRIYILFVFIILVNPAILFGQDSSSYGKRPKFIGITYQAGKVLQSNDFLKGKNASGTPIDYFHSGRLEYGWQTDGRKMWQRIYGLPYYGVGYYHVNFSNRDELGSPSALYGFFGGPVKRFGKLSLDYNIGFGFSYNWQPYDKELNPYNYAVGSYSAVYVDAGLLLKIRMMRYFDLDLGISLTHFSNGAITLPNLGINLMSPKIALRYNLKAYRPEIDKWEIPKYYQENEVLFALSLGSRQVEHDTANNDLTEKFYDYNYPMAALSFTFNRQVSYKVKCGAGIDLNYDGTADAAFDVVDGDADYTDHPFSDKIGLGIVLSFEWVIHNLSLIIQPGYHVLRKEFEGQTPASYQRIGVKYHFLPNVFAGINIKAYSFSKADYIEWNVGYRIKWRKENNK